MNRSSIHSLGTLQACRRLVADGGLAAAEPRLVAYLKNDPQSAEASTLLGIALAKQGRFREAEERLDLALQVEPDHLEALTWAAAVRKAQGRFEDAIPLARTILGRREDDVEVLGLLGSCLLALGRALEAEASFRTLVSLAPDSPAAHSNLGMALRLRGSGLEALAAFRTALELDRGKPSHFLQLFKQLQRLSRWDEAIEILQEGRSRHPGSIALAEALALAYGRLNRLEEAEAIFQTISGTNVAATNSHASWLQEEGRFEDSARALRVSLRLEPLQGEPYRNLVEAGRFDLDGTPILETAVGLIGDPRIDDATRMHLSFALGKLYEAENDFESAMRSFDEANEAAYRVYPSCRTFDLAWTAREPELISDLYSPAFLDRVRPFGSPDARPIFIVGMIRSGTTLLDQIVSSHPNVVSVGEGAFWNAEADAIHPRWSRQDPDESEIAALAERYLTAFRVSEAQSLRFTDKMPLNYRHLGLIHAVFPEARFLHIRRSPLDTCLSIYSTFLGGAANFVYKRENIVSFYQAYLGFMDHWRTSLPSDRLFELDYETLVSDPGPLTREIVDFMGLPWDEACLRHERNRGTISTPSRWQARRPVYRSSVARWRRYEPWLGSFLSLQGVDHPPVRRKT